MVLSCNGAIRARAVSRRMARRSISARLPSAAFRGISYCYPQTIVAQYRTIATEARPVHRIATEPPDQIKSPSTDRTITNHDTSSTTLYSLPFPNDPFNEDFLPYNFRMRSRPCPRCGSNFLSDASLHSHIYRKHPKESEAIIMESLELKPLRGTWGVETISAQLDRSVAGVVQLALYICPRSLETPRSATNPVTNPSQAFQVDIRSFKMNSKVNFQHSWRMREWHGWDEQTNSLIKRSWARIISWLYLNTAENDPTWIELTFRGSSWHLRDFYLYIFGRFQGRATPLHPTVAFERGTMTVVCDPRLEEQIRMDYEERMKAFGDHHLDFQAVQIPDRNARIHWDQAPPSSSLEDYLRPPATWTKENLLSYVESITKIKRAETMDREGGDVAQIRSTLDDLLFRTPSTKPFVSWAALHTAFEFIVQAQPVHEAWKFLKRAEKLGFPPNVEFFNSFLARQPIDYTLISQILSAMTRSGISANMNTWVALASAAPSVNDHTRLLRYMRSHSLSTDIETERRMAVSVIKFTFGTFLDRGGLIHSYLDMLNSLFPKGWLSGEALAAIVHGLGIRLRMLDAIALVDTLMFEVKKCSPGEEMQVLNALLKYCHLQNNTDLAVWTVVYAAQHWRLSALDVVALPLILRTAWDSQMHNVFRAAWVYGVSVAGIDALTHRRVFGSLRNRADGMNPIRFDKAWKISAGPVACATDPDPSESAGLTPQKILDREYKSFYWQEPVADFAVVLARALVKDKLWRTQQRHLVAGVRWQIENAVKIKMAHKRWRGFI